MLINELDTLGLMQGFFFFFFKLQTFSFQDKRMTNSYLF